MPKGGARPGAGRKPRAERFEKPIAAAERKIASRLPELVDNQLLLAMGGGERVEERYEAAGAVLIDGILMDEDGQPVTTGRGQPIRTKVRAFPDLPPDELVLVERKVTTLAPDARANEYLIDRILGKPTASVEVEGTLDAGDALLAAFGQAVGKIYGEPGDSDASGGVAAGG